MLVDIPKDVQFATADYTPPEEARVSHYQPRTKGDADAILAAVEALEKAERPVIYSGGGVINSGPEASRLLRELADATGFPITSTLMGLGAYPASGKGWIGMLGMHGTYEANWAMHDCDFMLCIGARFDDRITGRTDAFSPGLVQGAHRHRPLVDQQEHPRPGADRRRRRLGARRHAGALEGARLEDPLRGGRASGGSRSSSGAARNCLAFRNSDKVIKPQYALAAARGADPRAATATSAPRSASTRCGRRST